MDYNGKAERIVMKPTVPKSYRLLLDRILDEKQKHTARIIIKDYGVRKNKIRVHGEIQLTIPLDFYYKCMVRYKRNYGRFNGGVDVNTDRVNLAIIDRYGRLRDVKTFWYEDASRKEYPRRRARSIMGMRIHEMLRYAYHHGVKTLLLENPSILGKLKLLWVRNGRRLHKNYNWKVTVFRSSVIEMISMKAPLYSIKVGYIDPMGTASSKEHDKVMESFGLDRHTASAYLIALRGIKGYKTILKATT